MKEKSFGEEDGLSDEVDGIVPTRSQKGQIITNSSHELFQSKEYLAIRRKQKVSKT